MGNREWSGYIWTYEGELRRCSIFENSATYPFVAVYIGEELADDIDPANWKDSLADLYGDQFFVNVEDFKQGDWLTIDEVWPE